MGKKEKHIDKIVWIIVSLVILFFLIVIGITLKNNIEMKPTNTENIENTENKIKTANDVTTGELLNALKEVESEQQPTGKELIHIKSVSTSKPNSVGGVDLEINWTNMSEKTIKYITFTAYPINAVEDIVYCSIRPQYYGQFKGQETGPINKGEGSKADYVFANAWYNNTIVKAIIMQVDIEYMDGSNVSLSGSNLDETIY